MAIFIIEYRYIVFYFKIAIFVAPMVGRETSWKMSGQENHRHGASEQ